ncbi:17378_t:CDS:10 [Acaulospora colombiana]|uniref:17378_t:CDS:1 n=1 Tax=Acaulospora colombiana TaxID=27376 RepID=A0ACA9LE75_9GLOM|nr:17378_t:CDS:10 [Acaulospora colombiana]
MSNTNGILPVTSSSQPLVVGSRSAAAARSDGQEWLGPNAKGEFFDNGECIHSMGIRVALSWMSSMQSRSVARIAEEAGACAVMALERVPADIRKEGGVARMSDPQMIKEIVDAVTIPVMAKCRIGHFVEAQILQAIGVDYIDESEVLTPADEQHHINKHGFKVPFVCGAKNLGEALRRISEGAAFIRTKGEAGTGNVVEAVRHCRTVNAEIRRASAMGEEELFAYAKEIGAPYHLLKETARLKKLPVVNFAAGGVATPVFVGSGIFLSGDPAKRARAIVQAVTHYNDPKILSEVSENLGPAMSVGRPRRGASLDMIAITSPSPSPPTSQVSPASNSVSMASEALNEETSLTRNTSVISTASSSSSSSSSVAPPPRPRPIRTYTGPQAKNVADGLPASPTTPKATQRNFEDYLLSGTPPGRSSPALNSVNAQIAHSIVHSANGLAVPTPIPLNNLTSGLSTPIMVPSPGTSTPNGSRSRHASQSNSAQNYRFEGLLGEGSYSTVHRATSLVNGQTYAIKIMIKVQLQRENKVRYANTERTIMSKLGAANHPGIIRLYSAFQDKDHLSKDKSIAVITTSGQFESPSGISKYLYESNRASKEGFICWDT